MRNLVSRFSFCSCASTNKPIIVNGNQIAKLSLKKTKQTISEIRQKFPNIRDPTLAILLVGNAADSLSYVEKKGKFCKKVGVRSELIHLPEETTHIQLMSILNELNNREDVDSILTQLPFPPHIKKAEVIAGIHPDKDVDGLQKCFMTMQLMYDDANGIPIPCTPASCLHILESHNVDVKGKLVVMLGKGLLVGAPLTALLLRRGAIVKMCDKRSDIVTELKDADIIIAATGQRLLVKGDYLKKGVVVIDVGCSRPLPHEDQTSVVGDVDMESVLPKVSLITPVPGGVGPVTVSMLIQNVVKQWIQRNQTFLSQKKIKDQD